MVLLSTSLPGCASGARRGLTLGPIGGQGSSTQAADPSSYDDAPWRGLGVIPHSGLDPAGEFAAFDARKRFDLEVPPALDHPGCRCGDVLRGLIKPPQCRLFAAACTPTEPVGPCMVSMEGTCAAWYKYRREV